MTRDRGKVEEIEAGLAQFTGTENYSVAGLPPILVTDGVVYLCENAACWWLIDVIASHQTSPNVAREPLQIWTLRLDKDGPGATIRATDGDAGTGVKTLARQRVEFTDFPLPKGIEIWFSGGVALLPSEY